MMPDKCERTQCTSLTQILADPGHLQVLHYGVKIEIPLAFGAISHHSVVFQIDFLGLTSIAHLTFVRGLHLQKYKKFSRQYVMNCLLSYPVSFIFTEVTFAREIKYLFCDDLSLG